MKALTILVLMSTLATAAMAEDKINLAGNDTPATLLTRQIGQKVELRLKSGDWLSGTVKSVLGRWAHLSALHGREFYDAVVDLGDVSAIVLRNDGK